jgi:hypothetical protein
MENNITAKKLFDKMLSENDETTSTEMMIEFAKLHCEAQLKAILKNVRTKNEWEGNTGSEYCDTVVDRDSIINAYNLNNIK